MWQVYASGMTRTAPPGYEATTYTISNLGKDLADRLAAGFRRRGFDVTVRDQGGEAVKGFRWGGQPIEAIASEMADWLEDDSAWEWPKPTDPQLGALIDKAVGELNMAINRATAAGLVVSIEQHRLQEFGKPAQPFLIVQVARPIVPEGGPR